MACELSKDKFTKEDGAFYSDVINILENELF